MALAQIYNTLRNKAAYNVPLPDNHPSLRGGVPINMERMAPTIDESMEMVNVDLPTEAVPTEVYQPARPFVPPRQAPTLNNSGSQELMRQAQAILAGLGNDPRPQIKAPNNESILLSLLPALMGAGTNYLGQLGQGYMAGQNQELALIEQERRRREQNIVRQAQAIQNQAQDAQTRENFLFGQENQNFRNWEDNERLRERDATVAQAQVNAQANTELNQYANNVRQNYGLSTGWTQAQDDAVNAWVEAYATAYGKDPVQVKARILAPQVGDKTGAQTQREFNADMAGKQFNFDTRKYAEESGLKRMNAREQVRQFNERMKLQREFFTENMGFKVSNFEWDKYVDGVRLRLAQEGIDLRKVGAGSESDKRKDYEELNRDITELTGKINATTDLEDLDKLGADLAGKKAVRDELENLIEWTDEEIAAMEAAKVTGVLDKAKGAFGLTGSINPKGTKKTKETLPVIPRTGTNKSPAVIAAEKKKAADEAKKAAALAAAKNPVPLPKNPPPGGAKPTANQIKVGGQNLNYNLNPKKK